MILAEIIDIVSTVFSSGFITNIFLPVVCLAFIAIIPCLLRYIFIRR